MSLRHHQNGNSSTVVVELDELSMNGALALTPTKSHQPSNIRPVSHKSSRSSGASVSGDGGLPTPTTAVAEKRDRWNSPRVNLYRTSAAFFAFLLMGMNDAAYGVCHTITFFILDIDTNKLKIGVDSICKKRISTR